MADDGLSFLLNIIVSMLGSVGMVLMVNGVIALMPPDLEVFLLFFIGAMFIAIGALVAVLTRKKFNPQ